jgi:hypothetical protein
MKYLDVAKKYGVRVAVAGSALALPVLSFAQTTPAQPDTTDAVAYLAAAVATILAAFGGKYIISAVMFVARKVQSAVGGR